MFRSAFFKRLSQVSLLALCTSLSAAVWYQNDFEKMPSLVSGTDSSGSWKGLLAPYFTLAEQDGGKRALCVKRVDYYHEIVFEGKTPVPANRNFTASFRAKKIKGQVYTVLNMKNGKSLCGLNFSQTGKLMLYDAQQRWTDCGIVHASDGWLDVEVSADLTEGVYIVTVTDEKGKRQVSTKAPLLGDQAPAQWKFGNCMPKESQWLIDDVMLRYDDRSVLKNRTNVAGSAGMTRKGDVTSLELKELAVVSTLRLKGNPGTIFSIRARNNMGQWIALAKNKAVQKDGILQIDFAPEKLNLVEITSATPPESVELYSSQVSSAQKLNREFSAKVYGEFYLPVYTAEKNADLHLFNTTKEPLQINVLLLNRKNGKAACPARSVTLKEGENVVEFELASLPAGEYAAVVEHAATKGRFSRCLRYQPKVQQKAQGVQDFTGEKMFFADDYYFQSSQGISFTGGKGEIIKVSKTNTVPGLVMQCGDDFCIEDGCLKVQFYCMDNFFRASSLRRFVARAPLSDPYHWEQEEIPAKSFKRQGTDVIATMAGEVRADNRPKPGADGKIEYRLYNAQTDGPVDVRQVEIKWFSFYPEGSAMYTPLPKCDGAAISARTTWVLWHKQPGLTLILGNKPLLRDGISADELGGEEDSNDNFAGQYLSADGKTLYYVRGRILRRYPPYNVPYDNGSDVVRMLTVFKTTDGLHFEQSYMAVPNHEDVPGTQHYGARMFKLRQGHGLRLALFLQYFAADQRIAPSIAYSHDGFHYDRMPHSKALVDNGPAGSWNAGSIMIGAQSVLHEGNLYYLLAWSCSAYHICSELMWDRADMNTVTASFVKDYMSGRQIEKWPILKDFKDWGALAKNIRETTIDVSLMRIREDGLFYATAQNGVFTTVPLTTQGKTMKANVDFKEGGKMEVEMLAADGHALQKAVVTAGGVDVPVFQTLPQEPFQLRVRLVNGNLYSLKF